MTKIPPAPNRRPTPMSRRKLLRALSLATVSVSGALPFALQARAQEAGLITGSVCLVQPELAEGPFHLDDTPRRSDIREGRQGVPLALRLQVVTADCGAIPGALVEVWHCDAAGVYSGVSGQGGTFLRGLQETGPDGVAAFATIYPGWYPGRTPHIHYKVQLEDGRVLTSQMFFPDSVSAAIYEVEPAYARRGAQDTANAQDGIASAAGERAVAAITGDMAAPEAALVVGVAAG
ncbi:MAG: intradiol ring-cleavage dioxygenase [Tranquillimonas sp.]